MSTKINNTYPKYVSFSSSEKSFILGLKDIRCGTTQKQLLFTFILFNIGLFGWYFFKTEGYLIDLDKPYTQCPSILLSIISFFTLIKLSLVRHKIVATEKSIVFYTGSLWLSKKILKKDDIKQLDHYVSENVTGTVYHLYAHTKGNLTENVLSCKCKQTVEQLSLFVNKEWRKTKDDEYLF